MKHVALLLCWAVWGVASDVEVFYRRQMNEQNWKRGIVEECEPGNSFNPEFIEEGEAYTLEGYVPREAGKLVSNDVGVFVSISLDLGTKDEETLHSLLKPFQQGDAELIAKLTPYLGLKGEAAEKKLADLPLRLTEKEEKRLADATKASVFEIIATAFNQHKDPETPEFSKLPMTYRTLAMSLFSQQPDYMSEGKGQKKLQSVRDSIIQAFLKNDYGNLESDIRQLGALSRFKSHRKKEADLFASLATKCEQKLQVLFLVDESGSIGSANFELAKSMVSEFIQIMPDNQSLFGTLFYDDNTEVAVPYQEMADKTTAQQKIKNHKYRQGGTKTGKALKTAISVVEPLREVFNPQIYLLTDGNSDDNVKPPADEAREKSLVVNAIGVGTEIDQRELQTLAYDQNHWMIVKNYRQVQCNVRKFLSNICFQPDIRKPGDSIEVEFQKKSSAVFGVKVPKTSNVRVTIKNSARDACVLYGAINVEIPDDLVSHYFHSGNSDTKSMVFQWKEDEHHDFPSSWTDYLPRLQGLSNNVRNFLIAVIARLNRLVHHPDDRLVLGRLTNIPNRHKDHYYAFINIYSKNAKKLTVTFEECKPGEPNCIEGTNDEARTISRYWFFIPVGLLILAALYCVVKFKSRPVEREDSEADYQHI